MIYGMGLYHIMIYGFLFFCVHAEGGEWLIAYRAEQRRQLRAVLSALPESYTEEGGSCSDAGEEGETDDGWKGTHSCLNREFVLHHLHVDSPSDVAEVNISGCGLFEVCHTHRRTQLIFCACIIAVFRFLCSCCVLCLSRVNQRTWVCFLVLSRLSQVKTSYL